jgi:hypothetical protein
MINSFPIPGLSHTKNSRSAVNNKSLSGVRIRISLKVSAAGWVDEGQGRTATSEAYGAGVRRNNGIYPIRPE